MSTVAIIGAGPSGLVSAKSALECGLQPTVFDKDSTIGGLWKPGKEGGTWDNMQTNLSFYTCMFSDFPWNPAPQHFPTRAQMHQYLYDYSQANGLSPYLRLNTQITHVRQQSDKWKVQWVDGKEGDQVFDRLIVATGIFSIPHFPEISGRETFNGTIFHSRDYKNPDTFKDKKVIVVGSAFSGCEIVAEVASIAGQVIHSIRHPCWVIPRCPPNPSSNKNSPLDLVFYQRSKPSSKKQSISISEEEANLRRHKWFQGISNQDAVNPELTIQVSSQPTFVTISDTYLNQVKAKGVSIKKSSIAALYESGVVFDDGSAEEADALIFCTGYRTDLSFLDETILKIIDFQPDDPFQPLLLYKCTLHPELPTMAFVGMYRGPFFGVMELQARWACQIFSGMTAMPAPEDMIKGLAKEKGIREKQPRPQFPHGNYVGLADSLAKECGVYPPTTDLKKEDPVLYQKVWKGPCIPSHFRLTGPHKNPELARQVIEEVDLLIHG